LLGEAVSDRSWNLPCVPESFALSASANIGKNAVFSHFRRFLLVLSFSCTNLSVSGRMRNTDFHANADILHSLHLQLMHVCHKEIKVVKLDDNSSNLAALLGRIARRKCKDAAYCYRCSVVCLCVCLFTCVSVCWT